MMSAGFQRSFISLISIELSVQRIASVAVDEALIFGEVGVHIGIGESEADELVRLRHILLGVHSRALPVPF
jgi:hypothetical protein